MLGSPRKPLTRKRKGSKMEVMELIDAAKEPAGVMVALILVFALWRELRSVRVELLAILKLHAERLTRLEDIQIAQHEK